MSNEILTYNDIKDHYELLQKDKNIQSLLCRFIRTFGLQKQIALYGIDMLAQWEQENETQ